jgi:N-acetyl-gamma-glutamyl-phosphate reductase
MPAVFVDGSEGTTGLKIHDYLRARADIEVLRIAPADRKDPAARARLLNAADVAVLCLPDGAARESVALVENPRTRILDASVAFRTDPAWTYGLPELTAGQRERVAGAARVSVPGCHATAFVLLLRPLLEAGLLRPEQEITATSITGYSGGGKRLIGRIEGGEFAERVSCPYALDLEHKHRPEMMVHTGLTVPPLFLPTVGAFYQGLVVSVPLRRAWLQSEVSREGVLEILERHYAGEPCVRVAPAPTNESSAGMIDPTACNGTNRADLFVHGNAGEFLLLARLDNLGKGACGAAMQNLNLMLGLAELTGLAIDGPAAAGFNTNPSAIG